MTHFNRQYKILTPRRLLNIIIAANVTLFIISLIFSGKDITFTMNPFHALTPSMDVLNFLGASGRLPIVKFEAWWSLITANWLHGGLLHIVFNMMALRTVAPLVITEFGMSRMFSIYTLSGIAGFLLSYFGNVYLTIGASSGLCGLIGASLYFGRSRGGQWGRIVYKQTSGWVVSLVLIGFLLPNINNYSHAGGLLGGILFGWMFSYSEKRKENIADIILALLLTGITVFLLAKSIISGFILIFL